MEEELVTCLPVIQEVLQGFRDEAAHRKARAALCDTIWRFFIWIATTMN
jgi:hypothetical protein